MEATDLIQAALRYNVRLATAESLTGGLVAATLTSVPGSSAVVAGGIVSYMLSVKERVLGVDPAVLYDIPRLGAVSAPCACAMAEGACRCTGASIAVSLTGIAGPTGDEPGKPVGTVYVGIASARGARAVRLQLATSQGANRNDIRKRCVAAALQALYGEIMYLSQRNGTTDA